MSKLIPTAGHVVLRPIEEEELMTGNIVIPDMGHDRPEVAEVIAVSPHYNFHTDSIVPLEINIGDKALLPKMGSQAITLEGEEYYITQLNQILAILKE